MAQTIWQVLEEKTRAWSILGRQSVADGVWADYVRLRFGHSGDTRAVQFLAPYLNHVRPLVRRSAIEAAAGVFEGRGEGSLDQLDYFTKNPNLEIRDRAAFVVAAAMHGSDPGAILRVLAPYLEHRNHFIRRVAVVGAGLAADGTASDAVAEALRASAARGGAQKDELISALSRVYAGKPNESIYAEVTGHIPPPGGVECNQARSIATLVHRASDDWFRRALAEVIKPYLDHSDNTCSWARDFIRRDGILALSTAGEARGMEALEPMLHLRNAGCTLHALLQRAPLCFLGAQPAGNRDALIGLLARGDLEAQRIAALCLGRLLIASGDAAAATALAAAAESKSYALRASALLALGMVGASSSDASLADLCLRHAEHPQTASSAVRALGLLYMGSSNKEVFHRLQESARMLRSQPVRSKRHNKPLAACIHAVGLVYLGTGSAEPTEFLLDTLSTPARSASNEYHGRASRALVSIEYTETQLGWHFILQDGMHPVEAGREFWRLWVP